MAMDLAQHIVSAVSVIHSTCDAVRAAAFVIGPVSRAALSTKPKVPNYRLCQQRNW